ncbi:DUF3993 domain-containing protein [Bacillus sp. RO1]|uniref:DUF3993 domain-containing protein n=1 Tax=Bacillus sp. RO1 TaxID=2722703 RepID=UPI0014577114|nr:DUF3993 domain-containing protein [Bacillus sp. RO1]NLP50887.1 DUF3993 domain-containing protein [Bacillus sp. RO1]
MLKNMTGIIAIITIIFFGSSYASAEQSPEDHEVYSFLKDAFQLQISLGEKHHSLEEIDQLLNPYFTKEYQQSFLKEHLFKEEAGYITYGTDFPAYYIPFFSYDEETKVIKGQDGELIVYEFFATEEDMPSLYDDHYEYVKIQETSSGWKVMDYGFEYETPEFVRSNEQEQETNLVKTFSSSNVSVNKTYTFGMLANPFFHSFPNTIPLMVSHLFHDFDKNSFLVTR